LHNINVVFSFFLYLVDVLSTPSQIVFYERQLSFFNSAIHYSDAGRDHYFVWHEAVEGRDGQNFISSLCDFFVQLEVKHNAIYSDTCSVQKEKKVTCMVAVQNCAALGTVTRFWFRATRVWRVTATTA
jgi:hypothetical protein